MSLISLIPIVIFFFVISLIVQQAYQDFRAYQLGTASQLFNHHLEQSYLRSLNLLDMVSMINEMNEEDFCECYLASISDIGAWNEITGSGTLGLPPYSRWALGSPGEHLYGLYPIPDPKTEKSFLVQRIDFDFWDQLFITLPVDFILYHPLTLNVIDSSLETDAARTKLVALRSENQSISSSRWSQVGIPLYQSSPLNSTIGDPIQILFVSAAPGIELIYLRVTRVSFILVLALLAGVLSQIKLLDGLVFSKLRTITNAFEDFEKILEPGGVVPQEPEVFLSSDDIARMHQEFRAMAVRLKMKYQKQQESLEALQKHQKLTEKSHHAFLGYLGQEIRSPLHSMKGLLGILSEENTNGEFQEVLKILNQEIQRSAEIITLLLDVNTYEIAGGSHVYEGFTIPDLLQPLQVAFLENQGLTNREVVFSSSIHPNLNFGGPKRIIMKVLERILTLFTNHQAFQSLRLSCSLGSSKEPSRTSSVMFSIQGMFTESISIQAINPELLFIRYLILPLLGEVSFQTSSLSNNSQQQIHLGIRLPLSIHGTSSQIGKSLSDSRTDHLVGTRNAQNLQPYGQRIISKNAEPLAIPKQLYTDVLSQDSAILSQALFILRVLSSEREHVTLEQLVLLADSHLQSKGMSEEFFRLRNLFIDYLRPYTDTLKE